MKAFILSLLFIGISMGVPAQGLNKDLAAKILELPLQCIETEYPNKPAWVHNSEASMKSPAEMHPVFYGCFDWHSAVHGYWSIVRIIKTYPELDADGKIKARLNKLITPENVQTELALFMSDGNKTFERTYGWSWLLQLQNELIDWEDADAQRWREALQPLADLLVERYMDYLPKLLYPIRNGQHANTAFSLSLAIDYAKKAKDREFEAAIMEHSLRLFAHDKNCSLAYEPGGSDFLSPCLEEALLMSKVMDKANFITWLQDFLPELFIPTFKLAFAEVSDRSDGHLVHLDGLNFSRATCLYGIASAVQQSSHLRELADKHLAYSLDNIFGDHYMGSHWLGTFALYALIQQSK